MLRTDKEISKLEMHAFHKSGQVAGLLKLPRLESNTLAGNDLACHLHIPGAYNSPP